MRKHILFTKIISVVVVTLFTHQQIVWAQGEIVPSVKNLPQQTERSYKEKFEKITVPSDLAQVDRENMEGYEDVIINIQDDHSSLSAQYSIVNILKNLMDNYEINIVAVEGGKGYIDTSILRSFPDDGIKERTASFLMKEGKISAGEFFSVMSKKDVALYGVEEDALYNENLAIFRDIYAKNKSNIEVLDDLITSLKNREKDVYSPVLGKFVYKLRLHRDNRISFDVYWDFLEKMCVEAGVSTENCRNIRYFTDTVKLEKGIDFNKATAERKVLIDNIMRTSGREDVEKLVVKSLAFESGKIDQAEYHSWLIGFAEGRGMDMSGYPQLSMFAEYASCYRRLNVIGLQAELDGVEACLLDGLCSSDREKELYKLVKTAELLKCLFEIKLTGREVEVLRNDMNGIDRETLVRVVGQDGTGSVFKAEELCARIDEVIADASSAIKFYDVARQRDNVMLANTIKAMENEGKHVAALISGGHHSDGLTELMKDKNLSYLVLMPKTLKDEPRPYVAILTKKRGPYSELVKSGAYDLALEAYFDTGDINEFEDMLAFAIGQSVLDGKTAEVIDREKREWLEKVREEREGMPAKRAGMAELVDLDELSRRLDGIKVVAGEGEACDVDINGNLYRVTRERVERVGEAAGEDRGAIFMGRMKAALGSIKATLSGMPREARVVGGTIESTLGRLAVEAKKASPGISSRIREYMNAGYSSGSIGVLGALALAWAARSAEEEMTGFMPESMGAGNVVPSLAGAGLIAGWVYQAVNGKEQDLA
ncbi:MAG: hypothetical protein PHH49_08555, partial [Candidatus Omnitrophica bacterium]|nr:hypothetical protein [Candidatus Omnitrophota bacterium]MDD5488989.1 hypothetical protein [Candidatus Omnitrophota bacterium]